MSESTKPVGYSYEDATNYEVGVGGSVTQLQFWVEGDAHDVFSTEHVADLGCSAERDETREDALDRLYTRRAELTQELQNLADFLALAEAAPTYEDNTETDEEQDEE